MIKKYLLKPEESIEIEGNDVVFIVVNFGGQISVRVDLGELPISNVQGTAKTTDQYITLGTKLTVDGANAILERFGAKGRLIESLETILYKAKLCGRLLMRSITILLVCVIVVAKWLMLNITVQMECTLISVQNFIKEMLL